MAAIDAAVARVLALKAAPRPLRRPLPPLRRPRPRDAARRAARARRPRRRRPLDRAPAEPRRRPAAARPARPHRAHRPARRRRRPRCSAPGPAPAAREEAVGVLDGLARRPARRRRSTTSPASPSTAARRDGIAAAVAAAARGRPRHPLPRRGRLDERRGREPRPHRPARPPGRARRRRPRHRPSRSSSCSSPAARSPCREVFDQRRRRPRLLVPRQRGRPRRRRPPDRRAPRPPPASPSPGRATSARCRSPIPPAPAAAPRTRPTSTPASTSTCPTARSSPSATASPTPASPSPTRPSTPGERIGVETTVTNTGARPGAATVFLFLRDPVASVARPTLELRALRPRRARPGRDRRRSRFEPRPRATSPSSTPTSARSSSPAPSRSTSASPPTPAPSAPPASRCAEPPAPLSSPANPVTGPSERWPSGRRRSPAKGVYAKSVSRVRIPSSPPAQTAKLLISLLNSRKRPGNVTINSAVEHWRAVGGTPRPARALASRRGRRGADDGRAVRPQWHEPWCAPGGGDGLCGRPDRSCGRAGAVGMSERAEVARELVEAHGSAAGWIVGRAARGPRCPAATRRDADQRRQLLAIGDELERLQKKGGTGTSGPLRPRWRLLPAPAAAVRLQAPPAPRRASAAGARDAGKVGGAERARASCHASRHRSVPRFRLRAARITRSASRTKPSNVSRRS